MIMKRLNKPIAIHKNSQGSLVGNKTNQSNKKTKHYFVHTKHPFLNNRAFFNMYFRFYQAISEKCYIH